MPLDRLTQTRLNALVAKYLYRQKLRIVRGFDMAVTAATVLVPILFITAQWVAKGTTAEGTMNLIAFIGSALLICLAVLSLILGINKKLEQYSNGLAENIRIAEEGLTMSAGLAAQNQEWFYRYIASRDTKDAELLASTRTVARQSAYRNALRELTPAAITNCPVCGASPWKYKKGDCEACGNSNKEQP